MGLRNVIAGVFSFLGSSPKNEERMAQYLIREHRLGRPLAEIVQDHYVTNRCTPVQIARLLEREDVISAVGADTVAAMKHGL